MDELVQFLRARLDEDEQVARAAGGRSEQAWEADLGGKDPLGLPSWPVAVRYVTDGRLRGAVANLPVTNERSEDRMVHIARHDPARVLRDIEAKREVVRLAERAHDYHETFTSGFASALEQTLRLFALAYEDRPGYQESWRP